MQPMTMGSGPSWSAPSSMASPSATTNGSLPQEPSAAKLMGPVMGEDVVTFQLNDSQQEHKRNVEHIVEAVGVVVFSLMAVILGTHTAIKCNEKRSAAKAPKAVK